MSAAELSARLEMSPSALKAELEREPEPKRSVLDKIAKELAIPDFVFFMERPPHFESSIPDFRSDRPKPAPKQRATIEAIEIAENIQSAVRRRNVKGVLNLPKVDNATRLQAIVSATEARRFFDITLDDQRESTDARAFYYLCRKKIEARGIFVLHDSFAPEDGSGFCLADKNYPVIVVNTSGQTRGRRLFTLIHELGHVLLGKTGISDPFINENAIEKWCNHFAGAFLVPRDYVLPLLGSTPAKAPEPSDIRWASRKLKISQEATALRLEHLGFYTEGTYARIKGLWRATGQHPDYSESSGGSGKAPPQEKVKLAKYGFRLAEVFGHLQRENAIGELDVYRLCGLKPKYQRPYFSYASEVAAGDAGLLGQLDD